MIGPNNLLHPSPAPHFRTFQVYLIHSPKYPIFSTTQSYVPYAALTASTAIQDAILPVIHNSLLLRRSPNHLPKLPISEFTMKSKFYSPSLETLFLTIQTSSLSHYSVRRTNGRSIWNFYRSGAFSNPAPLLSDTSLRPTSLSDMHTIQFPVAPFLVFRSCYYC
jgi:hypothetical protein